MNVADFEREINPECEEFDDNNESQAENPETETESIGRYAFDTKHAPGFQATVAEMETAFIFGTRREAEPERDEGDKREAALPPSMQSAIFFGDAIEDKISVDLSFYFHDGVGAVRSSFFASEGTSAFGYYVCPLFTVVGDAVDPSTRQECLAIQFRDRFKRIRDLLIPRSLIAEGQAKLAAFLGANGFDIPPGKKLRERMQVLLHNLHGPRVEIVKRTGWHDDVFVLPERIIGDIGSTRIIPDLPRNLKIKTRGSLEGWQRHVASPARGNSRLELAISLSLASPLLRYAPQITPIMVQIFGPSSIGKSTAGLVAGSVWGGAEDDNLGYGESWNGTLNAHMAKAQARSGTFYLVDEMRTGENVTKMAYALSSGQGRGRLDKSANLRHEEKFSVFSLSTGEVTFEEQERICNPRTQTFDGAELRLPSIPADAGVGLGLFEDIHDTDYEKAKGRGGDAAGFANARQHASRENYGWAGPLFVERLLEHIASIDENDRSFSSKLNDQIIRFAQSLDLDPKADDAVKRLARTFGLIAAAGQLASDFKIVPIPAEEMVVGVRKCFHDWLASRGGSRSKTGTTALSTLRDYISKNMGRFILTSEAATSQQSVIAGYRQTGTKGESVFYLPISTWKEVLASAPRAKLVEELDKLGLLIRQKSAGTDTIVKKLSGNLTVRVYAVSGRILELGDDGKLPGDDDNDNASPLDVANVVSINAPRATKTLRTSSR